MNNFLIRFLCMVLLFWAGDVMAGGSRVASYDPTKIVEDETQDCAQCHEQAVAGWERSRHKLTFDELHLEERAQEVLSNMGTTKSIRRNSTCVSCHFTQVKKVEDRRARTILGISCQRCHGAAGDWKAIHEDTDLYPDRTQRLQAAEAHGLRSTANLYNLVRSCYECHTVPKENLVNLGGHHAGSEGFELVAWMYGEARHNFLPLPEQEKNLEPELKKTRMLYVLGQILDLEYGLRSMAKAKQMGPFYEAIGPRLTNAYARLDELKLCAPEIVEILAIFPSGGAGIQLNPEQRDAYVASADHIRELAKSFEKNCALYVDKLAAVDRFLPTEYRGSVFQ